MIGLNEDLSRHPPVRLTPEKGLTPDDNLLRRFAQRQRHLVEADVLVVANDHWNFDVRGFNPGGNHGSFFRISTHSVFMIAGGADTKIPQALTVEEPYDSLRFAPTLLALTGDIRDDNNPVPILWYKGFRQSPSREETELLPNGQEKKNITSNEGKAAP